MRIVVAKAAQSKAIRDAIFRVVPKSIFKALTNKAKELALGEGLTMKQRRENVKEWIKKLGIDENRVFAALGVTGYADIGVDLMMILAGVKTAISDGDVTPNDAFPPLVVDDYSKGVVGLKDIISKDKSKTKGDLKDEPDPETQKRARAEADKLRKSSKKKKAKKKQPKPEMVSTPQPKHRFQCSRCDKQFDAMPENNQCDCLGEVGEIVG